MTSKITRRDFLDGVALSVVAAALPAALPAALASPATAREAHGADPASLTGMRGSHDGSYEAAHRRAFEGEPFALDDLPVAEEYDLVVVGAGVSGLAAAWFHRERFGAGARILVLDNHDDFGGHARRNEFDVGGRLLLSYAGSESLQSPNDYFTETTHRLMRGIGVDIDRFEEYFHHDLYASLGLQRATFFDVGHFGEDRLVTGDPTLWVADDSPPGRRVERDIAAFIGDFPMSEEARAGLLALHQEPRDVLSAVAADERRAYLARKSYVAFLREEWGLPEEAIAFFRQRSSDFFGVPPEFVPALDAWECGYPGFQGIALDDPPDTDWLLDPYIHHFPDGNASIARLLVRALVPQAAPGATMEDVVLAPVDYAVLDAPGNGVRLRLSATALAVREREGGVDLGYERAGERFRVRARACVMAGWNMMAAHVVEGLPEEKRAALAANVKAPLVYAKAAIANWSAFAALKTHEIYAPGSFFCRVKLDYPVSMGGYAFPQDPSEPMILHLVHIPTQADGFDDPRDAVRAGRASLLGLTFADFEREMRDQLQRMLGPGGFDAERDITAITVNRWSHGYSYYANSLVDDEDEAEALVETGGAPFGRIVFAGCDRDWEPYLHASIDAAARAIGELPEA